MLTDEERKGCLSILKKLSRNDLLMLKDTVTNRQIYVESSGEAIDVIIAYSETPICLLKRKKIMRDYLFQYLHQCGIVVSPNADKHQLIAKILEYWNSVSRFQQDSLDLNNTDSNSAEGDNYQRHFNTTVQAETSQFFKADEQAVQNLPVQSDESHHITSRNINRNCNQEHQTNFVQAQKPDQSNSNGSDQSFAEQFVTWFYKMLNSLNPAMNQTPEDFGPHHFWDDIKLNLISIMDDRSFEEFQGSEIVHQRYLAFVKQEFLLFNPNVCVEGVQIKRDPHGLVLISVCGTVHRNNDCLGTFQQLFGIICDPRFNDNWKIKAMQLGIRRSHVTSIPKLENNNDMLPIDSNQNI